MDTHEDDISILPDTEEDPTAIDIDGTGLSPFRLSSTDIPASTHALQTAYRDLKKRYNESEQRYKSLRRQTRENSVQRMASENSFLSDENFPPFGAGMGEQGAAAMAADHSVDNEAKQGLINHLSHQLIVVQNKFTIYEDELKRTRQRYEDLREKSLLERERMAIKCRELEEGKLRSAEEVAELKETIRNLNAEVNKLRQTLSSKDQKIHSLQQQSEHLKLSSKSSVDLTSEYPSSYPGQKGSSVVSRSELQMVKEEMKKGKKNMMTLRQVVQQQNELIKSLQGDQCSKDSKEWESAKYIINTADFLGQTDKRFGRQFAHSTRLVLEKDFSQLPQVCADEVSSPFPVEQSRTPQYAISPIDTFTYDTGVLEVADCMPSRNINQNVIEPSLEDCTEDSLFKYGMGKVSRSRPETRMTAPGDQTAPTGTNRLEGGGVMAPAGTSKNQPVTPAATGSYLRAKQPVESVHDARMWGASPDTLNMHENLSNQINAPRPQPTESSTRTAYADTNDPGSGYAYTNPADQSATNRDCPVCGKDFSHVAMADFQNHVFECYDNTESGEIRQTMPVNVVSYPTDSRPSNKSKADSSTPRICPVCEAEFSKDIPQNIYERHVYEHFGEPPNIVDDFAVLHVNQ